MSAADPYDRDCPSRQVLNRVGDTWSVLIVVALADGPARYTALAGRITGVSPKMLTQTLRGLERDGMITRTVYPVVPPRVEYALTPLGTSLYGLVGALEEWARAHMDDVLAAREVFDTRPAPVPAAALVDHGVGDADARRSWN